MFTYCLSGFAPVYWSTMLIYMLIEVISVIQFFQVRFMILVQFCSIDYYRNVHWNVPKQTRLFLILKDFI